MTARTPATPTSGEAGPDRTTNGSEDSEPGLPPNRSAARTTLRGPPRDGLRLQCSTRPAPPRCLPGRVRRSSLPEPGTEPGGWTAHRPPWACAQTPHPARGPAGHVRASDGGTGRHGRPPQPHRSRIPPAGSPSRRLRRTALVGASALGDLIEASLQHPVGAAGANGPPAPAKGSASSSVPGADCRDPAASGRGDRPVTVLRRRPGRSLPFGGRRQDVGSARRTGAAPRKR